MKKHLKPGDKITRIDLEADTATIQTVEYADKKTSHAMLSNKELVDYEAYDDGDIIVTNNKNTVVYSLIPKEADPTKALERDYLWNRTMAHLEELTDITEGTDWLEDGRMDEFKTFSDALHALVAKHGPTLFAMP